jgi:hypothetical protein
MNFFFLIYLILLAAHGAGFTQPLREMNIRSKKIVFLGSKMRPVRWVENLAVTGEPITYTFCDP